MIKAEKDLLLEEASRSLDEMAHLSVEYVPGPALIAPRIFEAEEILQSALSVLVADYSVPAQIVSAIRNLMSQINAVGEQLRGLNSR